MVTNSAVSLFSLPLLVRALLLDALPLRGAVVLLSCNHTLRRDRETALLVLQPHEITRHCFFGRQCGLDWCVAVPAFVLSDADQQNSCRLDRQTGDAAENELTLADTDASVKLLSLAGLMMYALEGLLYESIVVDTVSSTPLPFLSPTTHESTNLQQSDGETESEGSQDERVLSTERATPFSLHFQNVNVSALDPKAAVDELRELDCTEESDEHRATVAHFERLNALFDDELLTDEERFCGGSSTVRRFFVANGFQDIRHEIMENANFGSVERVWGPVDLSLV